MSNGLGSPSCKGALGDGALSPARRRDCSTSGFTAAGAPTGNYGIDVHIDTGLLGFNSGGMMSVVQDLFVTPVWMAMVWSVHALVVMLEWCFAIDLLDSPASGGVGSGLRQMQATFTEPWLAAVLAVAAVLALYTGLIRRRVADTLGQAVVMGAMMTAGMWLIADPSGTVGALGEWANQASLGTLAVSSRGTPTRPSRALADSMAALFASAIEAPWCYLEFGDVGWCRNPAHLDPRLHQAALKIAAAELAVIGCSATGGPVPLCVSSPSAQAKALERSAALLRGARTNGAIFLALPANGSARNSINEDGSLLRAICEGSDATHCRGPTAAQAQFRTNGGTWSRVGGLLLIVAGLLGMLLLFGFIALRLLGAAIFSLLYLLLAPVVILAPALGEAGREVFRRWAAHLLAALVSKLLFAFLLGVVLAVLAILASMEGLGWWTQWLLMSAFWWGAYMRRHHALALAEGALGRDRGPERRVPARRAIRRLEPPRVVRRAAGRARERLSQDRTRIEQRERREPVNARRARAAVDEQAGRMIGHEQRETSRGVGEAPQIETRLSAKRARLARLQVQHEKALGAGQPRRSAELARRKQRIEGEIERAQRELDTTKRAFDGAQALRQPRDIYTSERAQERASFLDAQARLPASTRAAGWPPAARRDYLELAPLIGLGREHYQRLAPREQRIARLQIDRELALRRELRPTARGPAVPPGPVAPRTPPSRDGRMGPDGVVTARAHRGERLSHASRQRHTPESSVMRDAREVAARRKRQLGRDRP